MREKKLDAISPIDGRYRDKVDSISKYFSEKALIYYRLKVEIEYFLFLCKNRIGKLKPLNSIKGLDKLIVNKSKINADLEENWIIISEAIQTILRREGYNKSRR